MTKIIDHEYTQEITCPHCGREWTDSWEVNADDGEEECSNCEEKYSWTRQVSVTYSTEKMKDKTEQPL